MLETERLLLRDSTPATSLRSTPTRRTRKCTAIGEVRVHGGRNSRVLGGLRRGSPQAPARPLSLRHRAPRDGQRDRRLGDRGHQPFPARGDARLRPQPRLLVARLDDRSREAPPRVRVLRTFGSTAWSRSATPRTRRPNEYSEGAASCTRARYASISASATSGRAPSSIPLLDREFAGPPRA